MIPPMEHVPNDDEDHLNQQWNEASGWKFGEKSMETETTSWSEFPNRGEATAEQMLPSEERNQSERARLWESQSGIRVGKLTIGVRSLEIEKW